MLWVLLIWQTRSWLMSLLSHPSFFLLVFPPCCEIRDYFVCMLQCMLIFSTSSSVGREIVVSLLYLTPTFNAVKIKDNLISFTGGFWWFSTMRFPAQLNAGTLE